jgi:DNA polymerase-3 subunit alpha
MLGLYVSRHPLDGAESVLERNRDMGIAGLLDGGKPHRIAGIIGDVTRKVTRKNGEVWALFTLEDHDGTVEVACYPAAFKLYGALIAPDVVVSVSGRARSQEYGEDTAETVTFVAQDLSVLDLAAARAAGPQPVEITVQEVAVTAAFVAEFKRVLLEHPGDTPVHLRMTRAGGAQDVLFALNGFNVSAGTGFRGDVKSLLVPSAFNKTRR